MHESISPEKKERKEKVRKKESGFEDACWPDYL
jgi:hypothetical protein